MGLAVPGRELSIAISTSRAQGTSHDFKPRCWFSTARWRAPRLDIDIHHPLECCGLEGHSAARGTGLAQQLIRTGIAGLQGGGGRAESDTLLAAGGLPVLARPAMFDRLLPARAGQRGQNPGHSPRVQVRGSALHAGEQIREQSWSSRTGSEHSCGLQLGVWSPLWHQHHTAPPVSACLAGHVQAQETSTLGAVLCLK